MPNISDCNDFCATKWPPLLATDDASEIGRFTIITRADNSKLLALQNIDNYLSYSTNSSIKR